MNDLSKYKLIIFDLDGTLADRDTGALLEGVSDWFNVYRHDTGGKKLAIATNQGGVGLRHWMDKDSFGEPEKFPTEDMIWERINGVIKDLGISPIQIPVFVCFRYQSRKGLWSPIPDGKENDKKWSKYHRKPGRMMIWDAMKNAGGTNSFNTLMVGDSDDDYNAARYAEIDFMWAWEFFGREKPSNE